MRRSRTRAALTALAVAASVLATAPAATAQELVEAGRFAPLTPARVLDTREDGGRVAAGADRALTLLGRGGVPASGVSAVVLNVTVTGGTSRADLQVSPAGRRPARRTSNLNWAAGQTAAVQVQTGVGDGGRVVLSVSTGAVHVVVDVFGWYGDGSDARAGDGFTVLPPARVLDTRVQGGAVQAGSPRRVPVAGYGAVPDGATAVALNATVLGTPANADLQVFPTGARPARRTSNLNVGPGEARANAVVMPLGVDGSISLDISQHTAHVVLDVLGWYGPGASGRFVPVVPTRVLDTREDRAPVLAGQDRLHGTAGSGAVPLNADAAVLSVTAVGATAPLDLQVYPPGSRPERRTSTLNLRPATAVPNLAVARLGSDGRTGLSASHGSVHVVLDVLGYVTSADWSVCRNDADGWTAEYPGSWQTSSGAVMQTCRLFDPEPIVLDPNTEIPPGIAVNLGRDEVDVQEARTDPHSRLVAERETSVDGRPAYRQERVATEDGYVPAGTAYVVWLVDLDGETLSGTAWDWHQPAFARKVEVLDAMMARLSVDG